MKIALIGAIDTPIVKNGRGGTEIWTYSYAEKLLSKGHDVTLFADKESEFSGKLFPVCSSSDIINSNTGELSRHKFALFSVLEMLQFLKIQDQFDLVHLSVFSLHYAIPFVKYIKKPVVITVHGSSMEYEDMKLILPKFPEPYFVFISKSFEKSWPKPEKSRVIYNGIEIEKFVFNGKPKDYFFWISRMSPEKGVEDAIEFAKKTGESLVLAGPIRDQKYFDEKVKPNLGEKIQYVGELKFEEKIPYYQGAKALLMPIKWEEPFGLVVVESMACGTPVIVYNRGAMPEIIEDGKNGFLVSPDDVDGLVEAAKKITQIDRTFCRKTVEEKFSIDRMVDQYVKLYGEIVNV